jgi:hypothetical protein
MGQTVTIRLVKSRPMRELRTIRKWGDPVMVEWGFSYDLIGTSNFQAVRTWNDGNRTWGAVTNFLRIPHDEAMLLRSMQQSEMFNGRYYDQDSKMDWLFDTRGGTLYFPEIEGDLWETAPRIRWGTVSLGGNVVQIERYDTLLLSIDNEPKKYYEMARLVGFRKTDWEKSLEDLIETGLVHVCSCVYRDNAFSWNTPKGRIYSPFFSPRDYDFAGTQQPEALYLPTLWLE